MKVKKLFILFVFVLLAFTLFGCNDDDGPVVDEAPVISGAKDISIEKGTRFVPLSGITASDKEDGDLTEQISYSGNVNVNVVGEYTATYTVYDTYGHETKVSIKVTVFLNDIAAPILTGVNDLELVIGEDFDPRKDVAANDVIDGNLTSTIEITGEVDIWEVGEYELVYKVKDSSNNVNEVTRKVKVTLGYFVFVENVLANTTQTYTQGKFEETVSSGKIESTISDYGLAKLTFKASSASSSELNLNLSTATCKGIVKLTTTEAEYEVYFRLNSEISDGKITITGAEDVVIKDIALSFAQAKDNVAPVLTVPDDYNVVLPGNIDNISILKPFILNGVTANDNIDGVVTSKLDVDLGSLELGNLTGEKEIKIFVVDSSNNRTEETVNVTFTNVYDTKFVENEDFSTDDVSQWELNGGAGSPTITVENGEMIHQTTVKCDPG